MDYSPFNATVWILFFAFALITWGIVRIHEARNPGYPGKSIHAEK